MLATVTKRVIICDYAVSVGGLVRVVVVVVVVVVIIRVSC